MENKFNKAMRPIDYLPGNPNQAIQKIWKYTDIEHILNEIPYWFYIAFSHEGSVYDDSLEDRSTFITFYYQLLPFIEATFFYNEIEVAEQKDEELPSLAPHKKISLYGGDYQATYLSKEEVINPLRVIHKFCRTFPIWYVRIELWDFFQAVQYYEGPLKEFIYKYNTHNFYLNLLTLVEASHLLTAKI